MWTGLTWLITPLMIYWFGFNGVALSSFVISWSSIFSVIYVKKVVPIDFWEQVRDPLIAAIAMGLVGVVGRLWWQESWLFMCLGMSLCAGTYFGVLALVARHKLWSEVQSLLRL
jgi:O-antigen/teichoic acid export membrane protein